jgi:hypothetical protein
VDSHRDGDDAGGGTQGDINEALLYATIAIVGTHAPVWTTQ